MMIARKIIIGNWRTIMSKHKKTKKVEKTKEEKKEEKKKVVCKECGYDRFKTVEKVNGERKRVACRKCGKQWPAIVKASRK